MSDEHQGHGKERPEKQAGNSPQAVKGPSIISYNLREEERPGGLKARFKVKIETGRKGPTYRAPCTYDRCPHDKSIPRHAATHPAHPSVTVREDDLMTALTSFLSERVFGPDRAAMLTATLPASAAGQATQRKDKAAALRRRLAKIDTAENALITELEAATPGDPAAQALRQRIRARFTDLYTERTRTEGELAALEAATTQDNDPALLDALPILGDIITEAPAASSTACSTPWTSAPSTTTTCTRSPSTPPSLTPHLSPSPASWRTPAPATPPQHRPPRPPPKIIRAIRQRTRGDTRWCLYG